MTQSTHTYDWLLENTPQAVLIADRSNKILSCNQLATAMLGKTAKQLSGKPLDGLFEDSANLQEEVANHGFYPDGHSRQDQAAQILSLRPGYGGHQVLVSARIPEGDNEHFVVTLADLTPVGQACRLDTVFGEAYRELAKGTREGEVLEGLCVGVADALQLAFTWLGRLDSDGNIRLLATSQNGPLGQELQRVPERWDDCATGNGPAGAALRHNEARLVAVNEPGLQPWRKAATAQGVQALIAWPMLVKELNRNNRYVAVFGGSKNSLQDSLNQEALHAVVKRLQHFCQDARFSTRQQLIAEAMQAAGNAAFITDTSGNIQWANPAFARLCGHTLADVIGNNPRMLQSGKQGLRYYQRLWRTIQSGRVWSGETIERDRSGELYTVRQTISPVTANGRVHHYVSIHEDISGEKAMQAARERARRRDEITGLLTQASFEDRLIPAVGNCHRKGEPMALLLLAIDGFTSLRQTLGGDIEELLLETMGERIRGELDEDDFAAFINEGDFAIVLRSIGSREEAEAVGERLLNYVNEPLPLLGDRLYLDTRVGIAMCPQDASNADALMQLADERAAAGPLNSGSAGKVANDISN